MRFSKCNKIKFCSIKVYPFPDTLDVSSVILQEHNKFGITPEKHYEQIQLIYHQPMFQIPKLHLIRLKEYKLQFIDDMTIYLNGQCILPCSF